MIQAEIIYLILVFKQLQVSHVFEQTTTAAGGILDLSMFSYQ